MTVGSSWAIDANRKGHPVNHLLFAFIRGECPELEKPIQAHLAVCPQCSQVFVGLSQSSKALDQLKSWYLSYPEINSEQILAHVKRGIPLRNKWTGLRRREARWSGKRFFGAPQKGVLRLVSLPVAIGIGLLFMTILIVLASTAAHIVASQHLSGTISAHAFRNPNLGGTGVEQHLLTPPPAATGANATTPQLVLCSPPKSMHVAICGSGFKSKDRLELFEQSADASEYRRLTPDRPVEVNAKGEFKYSWDVNSCKNLPILIYAEDISNKSVIDSNTLTILVTSCQ
jgi:hypothetical protein